MTVWVLLVTAIIVIAMIVVVPFVVDAVLVANDPNSAVIKSEVVVFQATRSSAAWQYSEVQRDSYCPMYQRKTSRITLDKRARKAYLIDPGIFARRNQFEPMFPVIERDYDIYPIEYGGLRYDRERSAEWIAEFAERLLTEYDEVVYNGISHGGQHALYVNLWLKGIGKKFSRVILHDAPYGVSTMKTVPKIIVGLFRFTAGASTNVVYKPVVKLLTMMLPKRENVTVPSSKNLQMLLGRTDMSADEYFKWVKQSAKRNLSGHKFSMFYSETADMIAAGKEVFPQGAFDGVPVVYIRYLEKNDTVVQPLASNIYLEGVPGLRVLDIVGTHGGFTENYDDNVATLQEAIAA